MATITSNCHYSMSRNRKMFTYAFHLVVLYTSKTYVTSEYYSFFKDTAMASVVCVASDPLASAWYTKKWLAYSRYYISVVVMSTNKFQGIDTYFWNSSSSCTKIPYTISAL